MYFEAIDPDVGKREFYYWSDACDFFTIPGPFSLEVPPVGIVRGISLDFSIGQTYRGNRSLMNLSMRVGKDGINYRGIRPGWINLGNYQPIELAEIFDYVHNRLWTGDAFLEFDEESKIREFRAGDVVIVRDFFPYSDRIVIPRDNVVTITQKKEKAIS